MSSTLRSARESSNLRRQFAVYGYEGRSDNLSYFTVEGSKLHRIEADLSGVNYVIARDMNAQRVIDSIDSEIVSLWETNNFWQNIRVIRPGIARKFQAVTVVRGDDDHDVGDGNDIAYTSYNTAIYNTTGVNMAINDMLIAGHESTTINNGSIKNLPYGTFWAINDPIIIEYEYISGGSEPYRRAIKNLIMETTIF